uniref:Hsp70 binding protein n=1 Tax=Riptortus pedestris TaxID=329032 RepID=R4WDY6_RIPPE|nr:hsp70 binding protein [Riptortus pedestris]
MSGEGSNENRVPNIPAIEEPRPPRNLQDLLRYAVEAGGNSASNNNVAPLDPERRRFLEEALKSMTVDFAKELAEAIQTLKSLQNPESEQLDEEEYEAALDKIADFVDNIDAANDFFKLGGFDVVNMCLESPSAGIRWRIADVVAQCTQNNPFCQAHAVAMNFQQPLLTMVDLDNDDKCKVKAFFAVSCIVRDCAEGLKQFISHDGFSVVLRGMQSSVERLRNKTTFFLSAMITKNPDIKEILFKMGFVEQLIALIRGDHTSCHEHIISALLSLVQNYDEAQAECRRPEFELRLTLQNLLNEYSQDEAFREEIAYIRELMSIVFNGDNEEER